MNKKMEQIAESLKDVLSTDDLDGIKNTISEMVKEKSDLKPKCTFNFSMI